MRIEVGKLVGFFLGTIDGDVVGRKVGRSHRTHKSMVDKKGVIVDGNVVGLIKYGRDIGTLLGDDEFVVFA